MVLIDATYKTTKYALPLFLVVVRTNVGYVPVAEFVTENERAESIKEALIIIKDWNPNWSPKYFMMDYSDAEYQAIHHTFPDSEKYLCYFHVEQAWTRWTRQKKNGLSDSEREQLMTMLRKIANAPTRLIYDRAIEELKSSIIYKNNNRVKSYIDNFWLNIVERWCRIFFKNGFHLNVTTNNGVEALNNSLKKFYLKLTSNGTLSSLIDIIVNDFIPDQLRTYTQMNYQYCSHYKKYNQYVPMFLRNKPRNVVKHCLPRYASAEMYTPEDVDAISNEVFLVKSESRSNEFYNVDLGSLSRLPSCSCADFVKSYLPCKHMFAVFRNTRFTWDDLSSIYTSSPYLNLDYNFLSANTSFDISATTDKSDDLHVTLQPFNTQEHQNQEHQNQEHNLSKQRKNLQGNIKTLESISYLSTCSDTLDEVNRQVCKLINMLKSTVDKENNLPLHQDATVKQKQETPKIFRKPLPLRKRKRKLSDVKTTTCQWKLTVPEPSFDGIIEDSSNIKEPNSYSEATSIYPKKAYERGGLLNPFGKNLCFANSVLQLLRQTDIHRLLLIHKECVANSNNHCFVCQFKIFIERSSDSAESLCRILMERWTDFTIGIQQDSHEFLKKIMDEIQEKCYSAVNHSSNLFYGQQTSTITCNNCGNMTSRTEIFSDISISIDKAQNILEAMKEHFAAEKVDYYCSHCKSNTSAVKDTKLDYIPKNLILHLKRFDNSGKKICKMVDIHSNLQLGDFVSKDKAIVDQAKLVGMVVHCGKSLQTGHYYALIEFGDQWYIFDDMKIQKLAGPIQLKLDSTNNPYLLLYKMLQ